MIYNSGLIMSISRTNNITGLGLCRATLNNYFQSSSFDEGMENINALATLYSDLSRFKHSQTKPDSTYLTEKISLLNEPIRNNIYRLTWISMGKPTL